METTKQPDAPNCYKCDDMGYMPGDEVFGVSRCSCPIGVTADMRGFGRRFPLEIKASANTPKPLLERAYDLIDEARAAGQVLTIDLVPLEPLAMGNYEMVADLRPARERAPQVIGFDMAQDGTECTVAGVRDNKTGVITITDVKFNQPIKTMAYPDRRTDAAKVKVIWPDPSTMNFTPDRRDPYSTLTQEQHNRRSYDRNKK